LSLLSLYSHRNAWANLHLLAQPNTVLARAGKPFELVGGMQTRGLTGSTVR
jgi:hypothetical protein